MKRLSLIFLLAILFSLTALGQSDIPGTVKYPPALDSNASLVCASDNSSTTLTSTLAITDLTAFVASTASFCSSGIITIDGEQITFTGKTSTSFTGLGRAFHGTAVTHGARTTVFGNDTAAHHNSLSTAIQNVQKLLGSNPSQTAPPLNGILVSPSAGTSQWATIGSGLSLSGGVLSSAGGSLTNNHIFVGNASNVAVDVPLSGDASISNTGVLTIPNKILANTPRAVVVGTTAATMNNPRDVQASGKTAVVTDFGANKINIYNVSIPSAPVLVSTISDADLSSPRQTQIDGGRLYVSNQGGNSYTVFDITNPKLPVKIVTKSGGSIASPGGIYIRGNRLYLTGTQTGSQFTIFDNTNPAVPIELGSYTPPSGEKFGRCSFQSKYAYCPLQGNTPFTDDGLYVIDISNASSPTLAGRYLINGIGTTGAPVDSSIIGNTVYELDEGGGMRVIDVTDPTTPIQIGYSTSGIAGGSTGLWAQGRYVYVSSQINNTIVVFDVIDPTNPTVVATSAASALNVPSKLTVAGRYLYVVNRVGNTMSIVDLGQDDVAQLKAGALQSDFLDVTNGVRLGYGTVGGDLTVGRTLKVSDKLSVDGNVSINGTITSGTWNGSVIGAIYGGAGTINGLLKANGSGTVSLAVSGTDYDPVTIAGTGLTRTVNTFSVNTSQNIATLSNLTSNGFVKTGGAAGTLSIDTTSYQTTLTNSAGLAAALSDETGTGLSVFNASPTITNPTIAALANLTTNGMLYTSGGVGTLNVAAGVTTDGNSLTATNNANAVFSQFGQSPSNGGGATGQDNLFAGMVSNTASGNRIAFNAISEFTGTSNSTSLFAGNNATAQTSSASTANLTSSTIPGGLANRFQINHIGSGTVTLATAISARVRTTGGNAGLITDSADFNAETPTVNAATTWNTFSGLWVRGGSPAGTITTRYGVRVDTLSGGSTIWGLWLQTDNAFIGGTLTAGSSNTVLTDAAGKVLSAALNTVGVAQGGTGQTSFTDGQLMIGNTATGLLSKTTLTAGSNITITNGNGTITIAGAASGATTALDNLASVNINSALLYQTGIDDGSTTKPLRNLFLFGSGTYGTTSIKLTGTPTGARTVTLPDSNTTVAIASQQLTFSGPTASRTITFPDAAITVARTDAGQTFTGVNVFTSPTITTGINDTNAAKWITQTATASAVYGLNITNAALLGTVDLGVTAPTQVASGVAGTPISITASVAIAGSSNAGAVAGGAVTITSGAAARLTSGNANGGNISLVTGAGIGTGVAGQLIVPGGPDSSNMGVSGNGTNAGLGFANATVRFFANSERGAVISTGFSTYSTGIYGFSSNGVPDTASDTGIGRSSAGVTEFNNGTQGTLRDWTARASTLSSATAPITFSNAAYQSCSALTTSAGGVLTCTVSDARLKEDFQPFSNGLEILRRIQPQTFQWRNDSKLADGGITHLGFVAQNLRDANPLLASYIGNGLLQPEQLAIQAMTVQSVRELDVQVQKLISVVAAQQKEIESLRTQINQRH